MGELFYKPAIGWCGDFIPFWEKGRFHLFYLKSFRDDEKCGQGTPWYHISTEDFIHFSEQGEAIPRGDIQAQDLFVFTGSVIKAEEQYHIFYTGYNPHLQNQGLPGQAIMHAVSEDLLHWEKVPADTFYAFTGYERHDWRDPFVFFDEKGSLYYMLLAARKKDGLGGVNGVTALCSSTDLKTWKSCGNLWEPDLYFTHECPDLFRMGDWWYLIYSEFTDRNLTRYRMARNWRGPWLLPQDDAFDGTAYYAAKSFSDGQKRYLFGWIPTRTEQDESKGWDWGGSLGVQELFQRSDGTLGITMPFSIKKAWFPSVKMQEPVPLARQDGMVGYRLRCPASAIFRLSCKVLTTSETARLGIVLGQAEDSFEGYIYSILPRKNLLTFDHNLRTIRCQGLERPLAWNKQQELQLDILVDGEICIAYVNGDTALSARMCHPVGTGISLFVQDGTATFSEITFYNLKK